MKVRYKEAVDFIVAIADKKKTLKDVEKWIEANSEIADTITTDLESELREMKE